MFFFNDVPWQNIAIYIIYLYQFEPIAVETMGVYGEFTAVIIRAIGRRLIEATGDPREANWFRQNLAIAIQRGNAFSILSAGRERF